MGKPNVELSVGGYWRVWWSRAKLQWPALVWIGALAAFVLMFVISGPAASMTGVVDVVRESIAPLETARLSIVHVSVGDPVKAGDLVASLDTSIVDSELLFSQTQLVMDGLQIERQFTSAVVDAERDLQSSMFERTTLEVELKAVEDEMKQLEARLAKRLISEETLSPWRVRKLTLQRELSQFPERIRMLERQFDSAQALRDRMQSYFDRADGADRPAEIDSLKLSPKARRDTIDILKMRRENYFLRAGQDGVVSRIDKEPGEVVQAGEPVLSLVVSGAQRIIAFVPEAHAHSASIGSEVLISRASGHSRKVSGTVLAMGPEIQTLPSGFGPVPSQEIRGRRIVLRPNQHDVFLPGESVSIKQPGFFRPRPDRALAKSLEPEDAAEGSGIELGDTGIMEVARD
jgi:multidrug resistance efflux pump